MARRGRRWRSIFLWHRYLGLASALLVALLAVTGIAVNHVDSWGLSDARVREPWLLNWYGLAPQSAIVSYPAGDLWASELDGRLYLQGRTLEHDLVRLRGAAAVQEMVVIAGASALLILSRDGELIERLGSESLPGPIRRLGVDDQGRVVIETDDGLHRADQAFLGWEPAHEQPRWSQSAELPDALRDRVLQAFRGDGLPLERVLLDLHSGRIFGHYGIYMMDAAAVLLLLLTLSGVYNWWRHRPRRRRRV